jgi:hypothetical protein
MSDHVLMNRTEDRGVVVSAAQLHSGGRSLGGHGGL